MNDRSTALIKLIYSKLLNDKTEKEQILEMLLNTEISDSRHLNCIEIIKEITLINQSLVTLDNYLTVTE